LQEYEAKAWVTIEADEAIPVRENKDAVICTTISVQTTETVLCDAETTTECLASNDDDQASKLEEESYRKVFYHIRIKNVLSSLIK
jgi:hypothetical protein